MSVVNGHFGYLGNIANQQRKQAARAAADAAAAAAGGVVTTPGGTAGSTPTTGGAAPAPTPAGSSIGDSISGFFSNIPPPVMIAGLAILGIILLKRR